MNKVAAELLHKAKKNNYASKYFQTYYDAHRFNNIVVYYMEQDSDFDWSEYSVSVESQYNSYYRLTIKKKETEEVKENKYKWVIRNLTSKSLLYITVFPESLNNPEDRQWVLQACEEVLNEAVRVVIRKGKYCLLAELERLENGTETEVQSEIIFQDSNES